MTKLQIIKEGHYRVVIPKEITDLTGWDETTEVIFIPYLANPLDPITPETPIMIKTVISTKKKRNSLIESNVF